MSKKIKQLARNLFSGTSSSSSRRAAIMEHLPPELQDRPIAFQRDEVTKIIKFTIFLIVI